VWNHSAPKSQLVWLILPYLDHVGWIIV